LKKGPVIPNRPYFFAITPNPTNILQAFWLKNNQLIFTGKNYKAIKKPSLRIRTASNDCLPYEKSFAYYVAGKLSLKG